MIKPIGLILVALVVTGQSCTLQFGTPEPSDGGVYRTDDHAENWKQKSFVRSEKNRTVTIREISTLRLTIHPGDTSILLLGSRGQGVWRSTDRGERWSQTSLKSGSYTCFAFDPDNSDIVYTASGPNVFKSTDGGRRWESIYQESQSGHAVSCVAVDPLEGRFIWAVTNGGKILLSDDYGQNWTLKRTLARVSIVRAVVDPDGSGRLVVFTSRGLFEVTGRGAASKNITQPLKDKELKGATTIRTVTILEGDTPRWYIGTAYGPLVSLDRGASWTTIPTLVTPASTAIPNIAVHPNNPNEIFLTVGRRLHRTQDGGASWSVSTLPTSLPVVELQFDPADPDRLYFATIIPEEK